MNNTKYHRRRRNRHRRHRHQSVLHARLDHSLQTQERRLQFCPKAGIPPQIQEQGLYFKGIERR